MTDLEKQLESRFLELEVLEKRITELNSLGLGTFSVSELKDKINDYFPIINFTQANGPAWLPSWIYGGDGHFIFFRPIFNIADSSITIGVFWLLLFERKHLSS